MHKIYMLIKRHLCGFQSVWRDTRLNKKILKGGSEPEAKTHTAWENVDSGGVSALRGRYKLNIA